MERLFHEWWFAVACVAIASLCAADFALAQSVKAESADVKRGRYLVQIAGCNDCHTPSFAEKGGNVDEKMWLTGDALGWRGPWGTTYAANLRLSAQQLSEDGWMLRARGELRPPMPWFNLRAMKDADLRSIYRYLKHAGPAGQQAPDYVPPDREPKTAAVVFPKPPK